MTTAKNSGNNTTVQGTLNSSPNTSFILEFFANDVANPSGFGEGQTFLTRSNVTTDNSGAAAFTVTVSPFGFSYPPLEADTS